MKKLASMIIAMSLLATTPVFAQVHRDQAEKSVDRQEIRQDKQQKRDDKADLHELEDLVRRFDKARARRNLAKLDGVDAELRRLLAYELAEGRAEHAQKVGEAARSGGEVGSDQREVRRDVATGAPAPVVRDDLRDRRDDVRDMQDDRRDAAVEGDHQARRHMIARELGPMLGRHDARTQTRKRELMVQLVEVARAEVFENMREKREDKKELREDRRELREDIRQR